MYECNHYTGHDDPFQSMIPVKLIIFFMRTFLFYTLPKSLHRTARTVRTVRTVNRGEERGQSADTASSNGLPSNIIERLTQLVVLDDGCTHTMI